MSKPLNPWKLTGYKAGQMVSCKVVAQEPGGYGVIVAKDNLPGFLPSEHKLRIGEEVLAQFVCVHNNRMLLSSRFSGTAAAAGKPQTATASWQESVSAASTANEADAAFNVWAQSTAKKLHLKRATDLILPPIDGQSASTFKIAEYDLEWLITDLEGGMRTGCLKASSEERLSRSAALLYRGRSVGCIYGCKGMVETLPSEYALQYMMADLVLPQTTVTIYDLPEDIILSMSALFLGYPVERTDALEARGYIDYLLNWFAEKTQTACLAISLPGSGSTCLGFVHAGSWVGGFYVDDQQFNRDKDYVYNLIAGDAQAVVDATILPAEMISPAVRFGFSLSMARKKPS